MEVLDADHPGRAAADAPPLTRRRYSVARRAILAGHLLLAGSAVGCTLCGTPQAISVRTRLLGPDLWSNGGAVMLPLLLLLAIVALVAREPG